MAGGAAHGLDQAVAAAQEALFVGVEDGDQRDFRQVQPLAQQVDAHHHIVDAQAQVAQDLDALQRVDLAVQVVGLDAHFFEVVGQVLGHALGQRRHQDALALAPRAPAPARSGPPPGPSVGLTSMSGSIRPVGRMICSTICSLCSYS